MIINRKVSNVKYFNSEELRKFHIEKVYLESSNLLKRVQRVTTDHAREIGIHLEASTELVVGDILFMDDKNMIVVDVLPDDLLIIKPETLLEMGTIAHQLGNRHLPAQFEENEMIVQYDYLVEELLKSLYIPYVREKRKIKQAFRHTGHSHG